MLFIEKLKKMFHEEPKELLARLVSYFISLLILPNVVILLFLVYMSHYNFFSYDFFVEGIFGMKMFFLMTVVFLFFTSLMLTGGIIVAFMYYQKKCKFSDGIIIYIINLLFFIIIISSAWEWAFYIICLSVLVNLHISMLLLYNAKYQLYSFISFIVFGFILTIYFSTETARLLSIGLKTFGAGGGINVTLTTNNNSIVKGKLLLVSPKIIYLKSNDQNGTYIYPINNLLNIYIDK